MKLALESTPFLVALQGVQYRVWRGLTDDGVACRVFVRLVAVCHAEDAPALGRALREQLPAGFPVPWEAVLA